MKKFRCVRSNRKLSPRVYSKRPPSFSQGSRRELSDEISLGKGGVLTRGCHPSSDYPRCRFLERTTSP
ncbi:hypothetical protein CEXT_563641 [Caerostris extrusa]|uniref:Ycf15 n=1 Tax=Caerostris extrusa TaxID=172846 RepID=A0AAV4XQ38_CAEEX|nr:hypothetical protein CEXT_563641 [Caerostris extrusa]